MRTYLMPTVLQREMLSTLAFLLLVLQAVPSPALDCYKCADIRVQRWKSYLWEINLTVRFVSKELCKLQQYHV